MNTGGSNSNTEQQRNWLKRRRSTDMDVGHNNSLAFTSYSNVAHTGSDGMELAKRQRPNGSGWLPCASSSGMCGGGGGGGGGGWDGYTNGQSVGTVGSNGNGQGFAQSTSPASPALLASSGSGYTTTTTTTSVYGSSQSSLAQYSPSPTTTVHTYDATMGGTGVAESYQNRNSNDMYIDSNAVQREMRVARSNNIYEPEDSYVSDYY